jgi:hypothetical protein
MLKAAPPEAVSRRNCNAAGHQELQFLKRFVRATLRKTKKELTGRFFFVPFVIQALGKRSWPAFVSFVRFVTD